MSYEYKDAAKNALYTVYALTRISSEQIEQAYGELDHVYAQADEYKEYRADTEKLYNALKEKCEKEIQEYKAKADEYEAKAKTFDEILNINFKGHFDTDESGDYFMAVGEETERIIEIYESGESYV